MLQRKISSVLPSILSSFLFLTLSAAVGFAGITRPGSARQNSTAAEQTHAIPFELYKNLIFIQVRVNGSGPYSFLLDTGANASFLNVSLVDSLGIANKHQKESNIGTGESSTHLGFANNVTLSFSDVAISEKSVVVVPLADLESTLGRRIDGIVGADLFKRFVVTLDYAAGNITLTDPKQYAYHGSGEVIPLRLSGDRPFLRATITPVGADPIEGSFVIDTGDDSTLGLHTPFVEKYKLRSLNQKMIPHLSHGMSGDSRNWRGRIASFQLGKFRIDRPVAAFAEATKGSDADHSYDGAIGGEILRRFTVTFDYSRRQMILEPNAAFGEAYDFDMSGASLSAQRPDFKTIKVSRVESDSPAFEAGLREGDIIDTIDNISAADLGLQKIELMFKEDGHAYLLGVKRGDAQIRIEMKVRRLI
jgi:predicted aspartyl protease